jgi:ATP phosphoribosyltransferase
MSEDPLTLVLPKGRLFDQVQDYFGVRGLKFDFADRKLTALDQSGRLKIILVKNADLPTYVHHGIAGLGVCGDDVVYESGHEFTHLLPFTFGSTKMALAARKDHVRQEAPGHLTIATKFTRFTRDYFHGLGIPVKIIRLDGSVELAPVLGLAPYIVDLVETGSTLQANGLEVLETLKTIGVNLFANTAYFKLRYQEIGRLVDTLRN